MIVKRTVLLICMMLILVGCFRQADDTFDTVDSQDSSGAVIATEIPLTVEPTSNITVIDPNATSSADDDSDDAEPTLRVIQPTESDDAEPSPTRLIPSVTPETLPTATEPAFITPDIVEEAEQPIATEGSADGEPTLQPTPTAIGGEDTATVVGECDYVVQSGDNLFRIAINNDVALDALLSANGLVDGDIIQPGDVLILPNCTGDGSQPTTIQPTQSPETPLILDSCEYQIQDGDTLFAIAIDNDVVLEDLLLANELTEDVIIQPGDILTLPNCQESGTQPTTIQTPSVTTQDDTETITSDELIHVVTEGETLLTIARQYNITVNDILTANTVPDPNNLTAGQELIIPQNE